MNSSYEAVLPDPYDDEDVGYGMSEADERDTITSTHIDFSELTKKIKQEADENKKALEDAFASGEVGEPDEYPRPDDIFGDGDDDDDDDGDEASAAG